MHPWSSTQKRDYTIGQLMAESQAFPMERPKTWVKLHRAVPPCLYQMQGAHVMPSGPAASAYYYLRVTQENGQMAWTSPIWFE